MQKDWLRAILKKVQNKSVSLDGALVSLAQWPCANLGVARLDNHRSLRCGFAEVVFGPGKRADDMVRIVKYGLKSAPCVLATRVSAGQTAALKECFSSAVHNSRARTVRVGKPAALKSRGQVMIVTAGTGDLPAAEEAAETLLAFGAPPSCFYDVGVAGLHRLLDVLPKLRSAASIICVAGMEGALPSVVGGLVACPVISVPTSVGYGSSFDGLAALLAMLNTCAPGVSVVNIDNGFGAAMCALRIVRKEEV